MVSLKDTSTLKLSLHLWRTFVWPALALPEIYWLHHKGNMLVHHGFTIRKLGGRGPTWDLLSQWVAALGTCAVQLQLMIVVMNMTRVPYRLPVMKAQDLSYPVTPSPVTWCLYDGEPPFSATPSSLSWVLVFHVHSAANSCV